MLRIVIVRETILVPVADQALRVVRVLVHADDDLLLVALLHYYSLSEERRWKIC